MFYGFHTQVHSEACVPTLSTHARSYHKYALFMKKSIKMDPLSYEQADRLSRSNGEPHQELALHPNTYRACQTLLSISKALQTLSG